MNKLKRLAARLWAALCRLGYTGGALAISGGPSLPPPLTPEQEKALLARMAQGDPAARDELITHNLRLVVYLAKKYESSGLPSEDIVSIGSIRKNIAHWHFRCMKLLCSIFSVFICRIFRFFRGHFFRIHSFGGRSFRDILVFLIFFLVFYSTHVKSLRFPQPDIFCFYCKWLSFRPACHGNRAFLSCKNHSIHLGKRVF